MKKIIMVVSALALVSVFAISCSKKAAEAPAADTTVEATADTTTTDAAAADATAATTTEAAPAADAAAAN